MNPIISKVSKTVIPSKIIEKSKKQIGEIAFRLVEKEIKKYSEVVGLEFGDHLLKVLG
jgi:tRNA nucleotidyltransferase (CCA-adding enzyme)